jgi:hypothetical protein
MRHSDLPAWLKPALQGTRHGHDVEYDDNDIRKILEAESTVRAIDGLSFRVRASIPGRCWSCGGTWQRGNLFGRPEVEVGTTVRHVRRGDCKYRRYSDRYDWDEGDVGLGSLNPAVQLGELFSLTLRLSAEQRNSSDVEGGTSTGAGTVDDLQLAAAALTPDVVLSIDTIATIDSSTSEPGLRSVPVLDDAVFLGMDTIDGTDCMLFRSDKHGQIQVWVQARDGGELLFSYKEWDDRLGGTEGVYEGRFGDPARDTPIVDDED